MSEIKELAGKLSKINLNLLMVRLDEKGEKLEHLKAASELIKTATDILRSIKE